MINTEKKLLKVIAWFIIGVVLTTSLLINYEWYKAVKTLQHSNDSLQRRLELQAVINPSRHIHLRDTVLVGSANRVINAKNATVIIKN